MPTLLSTAVSHKLFILTFLPSLALAIQWMAAHHIFKLLETTNTLSPFLADFYWLPVVGVVAYTAVWYSSVRWQDYKYKTNREAEIKLEMSKRPSSPLSA